MNSQRVACGDITDIHSSDLSVAIEFSTNFSGKCRSVVFLFFGLAEDFFEDIHLFVCAVTTDIWGATLDCPFADFIDQRNTIFATTKAFKVWVTGGIRHFLHNDDT